LPWPDPNTPLGLDHDIDRDIDFESLSDGEVHAEGIRTRFHLRERLARRVGLLAIAPAVEIVADQCELSLLLSVADDRVRHRAAQPIGNDR